jgi:2-oxo-3-hexenedioate decarboxylase
MRMGEEERAQRGNAIAEELVALFRSGRQVEPFSSRYPGFDLNEAYAVAASVRDLRAARGERAIGRKIGFTNAAVQIRYGVSAPIWNLMFDSTVQDFSAVAARLEVSGLPEPRLEPEIALHIASAPRAEMSDEELIGCIDWVAHGFEIVQSVFPGWRFTAADAVAAYGLHGAYVLGEQHPIADRPQEWAEALSSFAIELSGDDGAVLEGHATNVLGGPLNALRHLLQELQSSTPGYLLQPGEIVTTGTLTDAPRISGGQTWSTRLDGIPIEGLRLRLA